MPLSNYICLNGEFIKSTEAVNGYNNRAFRFGDVLRENIHACSTEPHFLEMHIDRLHEHMQMLSMTIPSSFSSNNIRQFIIRLLNKNRIFGGAGIRLHVYRKTNNSFIPHDHQVDFLLESYPLQATWYDLNEKGLTIDISGNFVKEPGKLAALRDANHLLYLLAGMEAERLGMDDMVLLNRSGRMVETVHANLFLVSGNSVFTPSLALGCVTDVMRQVIIDIALEAGLRVNDQSILTEAALNDAEEVFLTDSIRGIQWVGAYRQIRYFKKTARILSSRLKEKISCGNGIH